MIVIGVAPEGVKRRVRRPVMTGLAFCPFWIGALACVPASEPRPPAGAGGIAVEPSAAARGEPFAEDVGWMLTVEKLIVRVSVSVSVALADRNGHGGSEYYAFDAMRGATMFARAIPVGPARVRAHLHGVYIRDEQPGYGQGATVLGVSDADMQRLGERADDSDLTGSSALYSSGTGPSVILRLRAVREDRSLLIELALNATGGPVPYVPFDAGTLPTGDVGVDVDIRANEVALAQLRAMPEGIFDEGFPFDDVASADADANGVVTPAELAVLPPLRSMLGTAERTPNSLQNSLLYAISKRIGAALLRARTE